MIRRGCNLAVAGAALMLLVANAPAADQQTRTWTDKGGKFTIDAKFVELHDGSVGLLRSDGKRIDVPLEKLSEADVKYVRSLEKEHSPFSDSASSLLSAETDNSKKASGNPISFDWRGGKIVKPKTISNWTFKPTAMPVADAHRIRSKITLAQITELIDPFDSNILGMYFAADNCRMVIARDHRKQYSERETVLEDIDLCANEPSQVVTLPKNSKVLDVLPTDHLVMYRSSGEAAGDEDVLTVARIEGGHLTPVLNWIPYSVGIDPSHPHAVERAWFLTRDRIMTANYSNRTLTVWDVPRAQPLWNIPVDNVTFLTMAISPDGHTLAIATFAGAIALIDTVTGAHVATIPTGIGFYDVLAFSDDNLHLAGARSTSAIAVWDLATGKLMNEIPLFRSTSGVEAFMNGELATREAVLKFMQSHDKSRAVSAKRLSWTGKYLLADDLFLYDLDRGVLLWQYKYDDASGFYGTSIASHGRFWTVPNPVRGEPRVLLSTPIPQDDALQLARQVPPVEKLRVSKPGDPVAIELDVDPAIIKPELLKAQLANNLTAAGLKVVEHSELLVHVVCKTMPAESMKFNIGNSQTPRPEDIVEENITPNAAYVRVTFRGETISESGQIPPSAGMIYKASSTSAADQAAATLNASNPGLIFLRAMKFTGYMSRPGKATSSGAYGTSAIKFDE